MKKLIDKKMYNTETAIFVASYQFSEPSDFDWLMESLYHTKKGNWFLHCKGGAKTEYGTDGGRWRSKGETIKVLDEQQVYEFLEKHNEIDAIEQYFPDEVDEA